MILVVVAVAAISVVAVAAIFSAVFDTRQPNVSPPLCQTIMTQHAGYSWLALIAGWLAVAAPAFAGVRDEAHLYEAPTLAKAEQLIGTIRQQYGVDVRIETVPGIPADRLAEFKSLKGKAQQDYLTRWATERAQQLGADGIYVLICKSPPHTRVVVEEAHAAVFGERERTKLFKLVATRGWWKSADQGLLGGIEYIRDRLDAHARGETGGVVDWGAILWVIGGLLGLWVVIGLARSLSGAGRYACNPGRGTPTEGGALAGVFGGMFGAMAGHWLYESFFGGPAAGEVNAPPETPVPPDNVGARGDEFTDSFQEYYPAADDPRIDEYAADGDFQS